MSEATPRTKKRRRRIPPGLLRGPDAAAYCGVGYSTWCKLVAAGLTPAPTKLNGVVVFNRRELSAWIDAKCPPRCEWEPLWADLLRRRHQRNR